MNAFERTMTTWKVRTRKLELGRRTLIMGVVNITPDSFSDGGRFLDPKAAVAHGIRLLDEGADLLDLGAESTRPGSRTGGGEGALPPPAVSAEEEQDRLLPVLEGLLTTRPEAVISVDTYKAATAQAACAGGAEIVNDVSGFFWDSGMAEACAKAECGVVLMHSRGRPEEWRMQSRLAPDELLAAVKAGLEASLERAVRTGISPETIVLDPGYGFGKKYEENYALLSRQEELLEMGRPLLAGVSRKSFLGWTLASPHGAGVAPVEKREAASVAAMVAAILHGASIVRVHEVRAAVEAALIADAVVRGGDQGSGVRDQSDLRD